MKKLPMTAVLAGLWLAGTGALLSSYAQQETPSEIRRGVELSYPAQSSASLSSRGDRPLAGPQGSPC
jgi:hypothetical protein